LVKLKPISSCYLDAQKLTLMLKVVKSDSKIIIWLLFSKVQSKYPIHSLSAFYFLLFLPLILRLFLVREYVSLDANKTFGCIFCEGNNFKFSLDSIFFSCKTWVKKKLKISLCRDKKNIKTTMKTKQKNMMYLRCL